MNKEKICGIYKITNLINGKVYIGQSINIYKRWKEHKNKNNWNKKKQIIYSAFKKYGLDNFNFEIIEICNKKMLNEKERFYIKLYKSYVYDKNSNGYNATLGGESNLGMVLSKESKKKMSNARKGKYKGEDNPRYGQHLSESEKKNISEKNKGNNKGVPRSEEVKIKISKTKKGYKHTEESKKKIAKSRKGIKPPCSKKVICEGIVYESIKDCANYYKIKPNTMNCWFNGRSKIPQKFIKLGLNLVA